MLSSDSRELTNRGACSEALPSTLILPVATNILDELSVESCIYSLSERQSGEIDLLSFKDKDKNIDTQFEKDIERTFQAKCNDRFFIFVLSTSQYCDTKFWPHSLS